MDEQQEKPGFRVNDRRRFAGAAEQERGGGEPASDESRGGEPASSDAASPSASEAGSSSAPGSRADSEAEPVTFSTFVLGLSTQALLHLGEIASPLDGKVEQDLPAAKHVIDILGILRDKTRSNLEQAEEHLLDSMLYDLRMRYVELVRGPKKKEEA
jgi:Domain of unknown function (DUF1844)